MVLQRQSDAGQQKIILATSIWSQVQVQVASSCQAREVRGLRHSPGPPSQPWHGENEVGMEGRQIKRKLCCIGGRGFDSLIAVLWLPLLVRGHVLSRIVCVCTSLSQHRDRCTRDKVPHGTTSSSLHSEVYSTAVLLCLRHRHDVQVCRQVENGVEREFRPVHESNR